MDVMLGFKFVFASKPIWSLFLKFLSDPGHNFEAKSNKPGWRKFRPQHLQLHYVKHSKSHHLLCTLKYTMTGSNL